MTCIYYLHIGFAPTSLRLFASATFAAALGHYQNHYGESQDLSASNYLCFKDFQTF